MDGKIKPVADATCSFSVMFTFFQRFFFFDSVILIVSLLFMFHVFVFLMSVQNMVAYVMLVVIFVLVYSLVR